MSNAERKCLKAGKAKWCDNCIHNEINHPKGSGSKPPHTPNVNKHGDCKSHTPLIKGVK